MELTLLPPAGHLPPPTSTCASRSPLHWVERRTTFSIRELLANFPPNSDTRHTTMTALASSQRHLPSEMRKGVHDVQRQQPDQQSFAAVGGAYELSLIHISE